MSPRRSRTTGHEVSALYGITGGPTYSLYARSRGIHTRRRDLQRRRNVPRLHRPSVSCAERLVPLSMRLERFGVLRGGRSPEFVRGREEAERGGDGGREVV